MKKNDKTPPAGLAGQSPRSYVQMLEEKIARYERIMQRCPKFRMEQSAAKYSVCDGERIAISDAPIRQLPAGITTRISNPQPPMADNDAFNETDWPDEPGFIDELDDEPDDELDDDFDDELLDDELFDDEFDDDLEDELDDGFDDELFEDELDDEFDDDLDDDDFDDDDFESDLETDGLNNPPSGGPYSEAVLQAFPHIRTFQRLVGRRR